MSTGEIAKMKDHLVFSIRIQKMAFIIKVKKNAKVSDDFLVKSYYTFRFFDQYANVEKIAYTQFL